MLVHVGPLIRLGVTDFSGKLCLQRGCLQRGQTVCMYDAFFPVDEFPLRIGNLSRK